MKYDATIDLSNRNESHTLLVELAGENRRVLDVGCASGALGQVLAEHGCEVVGIEIDGDAARQAASVLKAVVLADIEQLDLARRFGPESFDVIVFGDILEHLREPAIVLRGSRELLRPGGWVVISIPNIAHGAVRLSLLNGDFEYQAVGLLDETHVRFFTRQSLQRLLAVSGFLAVKVERTQAGVLDTEIPLNPRAFSEDAIASVSEADEALTYQFVVKAVPLEWAPAPPSPEEEVWGPVRSGPFQQRGWSTEISALAQAEKTRPQLEAALVRSVASVAALLPAPVEAASESGPERCVYGLSAAEDPERYRGWLEIQAGRRRSEQRRCGDRLSSMPKVPSISVLVPVYRPEPDLLRRCVDSVRTQKFSSWELCLAEDGSGDPGVRELLEGLAASDPRIRVAFRPDNGGISAATNTAAELATGQFLALLDQDDELEAGALVEMAAALADDPDIDVLYTDEDKLEPDGARSEPFFKPDWSPDQLLSHMYIGHCLVVRRALFEEVGGFRSAFDGSQDYDLALRATEKARKVAHLPVIAYHWRKITGSTAQHYRAKPGADVAARAALGDALARRGELATVESGRHEGTFRVRRAVRGNPLVSVVIPFHNGAELLRRCVASLQERSGYDHWEAVLVDNRSWEPETSALVARLTRDRRCRVVSYPQTFNWAAINNFAARQCTGDHLLFLNADIEGRSEGWLTAMLEHSQRSEIGVVGSRLLYPDGRLQHAGVVMGLGAGVAWHAFCFCPGDNPGYFGQADIVRNYSAVTGACMMVRRDVFESVGGFDESLPVAFNDIDFCLEVRQLGHRVVYTPFAELVHEESAARGHASREHIETALMWNRWQTIIRHDPYFNPNLDPRRSEFMLPVGLEEADPWGNLISTAELWLKQSGKKWPTSIRRGSVPRSAIPRNSSS